jgi:hypothetical protein
MPLRHELTPDTIEAHSGFNFSAKLSHAPKWQIFGMTKMIWKAFKNESQANLPQVT